MTFRSEYQIWDDEINGREKSRRGLFLTIGFIALALVLAAVWAGVGR